MQIHETESKGQNFNQNMAYDKKIKILHKNSEKKIVGNMFGGIEIGKTMDLLRVWNS